MSMKLTVTGKVADDNFSLSSQSKSYFSLVNKKERSEFKILLAGLVRNKKKEQRKCQRQYKFALVNSRELKAFF